MVPRPGAGGESISLSFFNLAREYILLILERGREKEKKGGRERNIDVKEKHQLVAHLKHPDQGSNP